MYLFIREQFSKEPCGLIVTSNYAKTDMGLSSNAKILCDDVGLNMCARHDVGIYRGPFNQLL
jgi:hypothetical protein